MEIGGFPSEDVSEALRVGRFECQNERIKRRVFLRDGWGDDFQGYTETTLLEVAYPWYR